MSLIIGILLAGVFSALMPARNQIEEDVIVSGISSIIQTVKAGNTGRYDGLDETIIRDAGLMPDAFIRDSDNAVVTPYGGALRVRQSSTLFLYSIPGTSSTRTATIDMTGVSESLCMRIVPLLSELVDMMWLNGAVIMPETATSLSNEQAQTACSNADRAVLAMTFY